MLRGTGTTAEGAPAFEAAPVVQAEYPGERVTLTAWAEGVNATGETRVAICWFTAEGRYLSQTDSPDLPDGATGWTSLSATSAAPSQAAYELVYLESGDNSGTVYFDDVTFAGVAE